MQTLKFVLKCFLAFFGVIYLLYASYVYFNQEEMIFPAAKLAKEYKFEFEQEFEELNIASFDGAKLNGLLFKASNPKGLVFYLHGNGSELSSWGNIADIYTNLGYDIFILDYRGYGKSEGEIDNQEQFLKDVSIAYDVLAERYAQNKITIIGYSIGTGAATYLASHKNPQRLILQSPYYNFLEFSSTRAPLLPDFLKKFTFETNEYIVKVKVPITIFHGDADRLIAVDNSIQLQKLLKPSDKFIALEGQAHGGMNDNAEFQEQLRLILN
ncbi:alpha/beta hydrolase [Flavobacterium sp.]